MDWIKAISDKLNITDFYEETSIVGNIQIYATGIRSSLSSGTEVFGSASGRLEKKNQIKERSQFELLERFTLLSAMEAGTRSFNVRNLQGEVVGKLPYSVAWPKSKTKDAVLALSNGVSLGLDWKSAARGARAELLERDGMQRAWFFGRKPEEISDTTDLYPGFVFYLLDGVTVMATHRASQGHYDLGFSCLDGIPLAVALEKAFQELLQRKSFCPDLSSFEEAPSVPGADLHLWTSMQPGWVELFERWIFGELGNDFELKSKVMDDREGAPIEYIDLSEFSPLPSTFVVKAISSSYLPLVFGSNHPNLSARSTVSFDRRIHPGF